MIIFTINIAMTIVIVNIIKDTIMRYILMAIKDHFSYQRAK